MSDPRAGLKAAIRNSLQKVWELEATVGEFNGDQDLLNSRINGLLASLGQLHGQRDAAAFDVPVDLIRYVDEGGNPDTFLGEIARASLRDNQAAKGKSIALESFRDALLKEAAEAFPEDTAAFCQATGAAVPPRTTAGSGPADTPAAAEEAAHPDSAAAGASAVQPGPAASKP